VDASWTVCVSWRRPCGFCTDAFHATEGLQEAKVALLQQYERHLSVLGAAR
jgi:hypothetical protein